MNTKSEIQDWIADQLIRAVQSEAGKLLAEWKAALNDPSITEEQASEIREWLKVLAEYRTSKVHIERPGYSIYEGIFRQEIFHRKRIPGTYGNVKMAEVDGRRRLVRVI